MRSVLGQLALIWTPPEHSVNGCNSGEPYSDILREPYSDKRYIYVAHNMVVLHACQGPLFGTVESLISIADHFACLYLMSGGNASPMARDYGDGRDDDPAEDPSCRTLVRNP